MNIITKSVSKALSHPTVARAHNAFMMYHFKDYGGAAKEAKGAGKDLYHRLKKALKKSSASEDFLKNRDVNQSATNESAVYNKSHPFHMKTDEQLKHIIKHYGRGGVSNPVEKQFYNKQKQDAEDILSKKKTR